MFEQNWKELELLIFIDERDSRLADCHGVFIKAGTQKMTWPEAVTRVMALDRAIAGGITYKRDENRLRSLRNQLLSAFGPDAEKTIEAHKAIMGATIPISERKVND